MTLRVLFVDDDPNVLRALARAVRIGGLASDAVFVDGGATAIAALEAHPFDAVVTDLAMPDMDGVTLLEQVRARWPAVSRVLLTGEFAFAQSLRATRVAHQFLAKPCDGALLAQTVKRLGWLGGLGISPALRAGAARLASLPSSPRAHAAIRDAMARNADRDTLGRLVETDVALTAKVLQLVSTPFFTLARGALSVRGAIDLLGVDVVRTVLSSRETFRSAEAPASPYLEELHRNSLEAARHARAAAPPAMAVRAHLAARLHDVGRLVLACVPEHAGSGAGSRESADCRAAAGGYLLGLWGLPDDVVHAVSCQHAPETAPAEHRALAAVVHAATRPSAPWRSPTPQLPRETGPHQLQVGPRG